MFEIDQTNNEKEIAVEKVSSKGGRRAGSGRKPVPDDSRLKLRSIRMSDHEWEKAILLGGSEWLRERVRRAKLTAPEQAQLEERMRELQQQQPAENEHND